MGLTVVANDVLATRVGRAAGSEQIAMGQTGTIVPGGSNSQSPTPATKEFFDTFVGPTGGTTKAGHVADIGRGSTDPDITYITLHDSDGVEWFIYPDVTTGAVAGHSTRP